MDNAECPFSDDPVLDQVEAVVLPIVLDLDGVHAELSTARVVASPPPSDRWHRLVQCHLEAGADPPADPEYRARQVLVSGAAFLLTEAADVEHQADLLRPGPAGDRLRSRLADVVAAVERAARRLLDRAEGSDPVCAPPTPAPDVPTGFVPVDDAVRMVGVLGATVDLEEARGSVRHRPVSAAAKVLSIVAVLTVDLPITLWLSRSVLDGGPDPATSVWSVVVALVATAGVVILPYQLGRDFRVYISPDRHLRWSELPTSSRLVLTGSALLIAVVSAAVLVSVARAGLPRPDLLDTVVAVLVMAALPVGAGMAFRLALRDGSPERDELARTSRGLRRRWLRRRRVEDRMATADHRLRLVRCADHRERRRVELEAATALAARVLTEPVVGPRGHLLTVEQAQRRRDGLQDRITAETAAGSLRHRRVPRAGIFAGRVLPVLVASLVLPGVPVAWAYGMPGVRTGPLAVVGLLVVAVGAAALHHLGRELRHHKGADRRLHLPQLGRASRLDLFGLAVLGVLLATAVVVGVHRLLAAALPGPAAWTTAALAAATMAAAATAIVTTAFRDGSPQTDDVHALDRAVEPHRRLREHHLATAATIRAELVAPACPPSRHGGPRRWTRARAGSGRTASLTSAVVAVTGVLVAGLVGTGHGQTLALLAVLATPVLVVWRAWRRAGRRRGVRPRADAGCAVLARRLDRLPAVVRPREALLTVPARPSADAPPRPGPGLDWATPR